MIPDSETFMSMLKNQEQVVRGLLKDLDVCNKNMQAFEKLESLYEQGEPVSTDKALKACAKSLRHMNDVNRRMLMLLLVYVSGGDYSSDTGKVLVKMGRGEEALREMVRQKFAGV